MRADFRVGDWLVRPERLCMDRPGKSVHVTPKAMAVLQCLAAARGEVVARNAILDTVWPAAAVTDDVLTQCVVELRKAFDDSAQDPGYIETIPRRGFRLVAPVSELDDAPAKSVFRRSIAATIVGFVIAGLSLAVFDYSFNQPPADKPARIAVLPFTDLSSKRVGTFGDGLTDELINCLTKLDGVQVIGRASSNFFRGSDEDVHLIGRQLEASHVLEGSVQLTGDTIRVVARLTDVAAGHLVWTDSYALQLDDYFDVQREIAESVAGVLSIGLGVGPLAEAEGATRNVDAYKQFLEGNAAYLGPDPDPVRAVRHYQSAVDLDPEYALAWAMLAETCFVSDMQYIDKESLRFRERGDQAIARALELAPDSTQVLTTLAQIEIFRERFIEARHLLDRMRERYEGGEIRYPLPYVDLALKMGHLREADLALQSNYRLDRYNPVFVNHLSHYYLIAGRPGDALAELETAYVNGNRWPYMANVTVNVALATGNRVEVEKWLRRASAGERKDWLWPTMWDHLLERLDDRAALVEYLEHAQANTEHRGLQAFTMIWASYLGEDVLALRAMEESKALWMIWNPLTKRIRHTEEFKQIIVDTGAVNYWREFGWGNFCSPTDGDDFECR